MLDTVRNGVMSAMARMYFIVMIFLRHLLESATGQATSLAALMFIKEA